MGETLWIEKYRPKVLDEMVDQEEIVARLKDFVGEKSLPHLLFAGPPGTGKTTAALCLARELYGERWRDNVLERNASVTPDTPVLVRYCGVVARCNFGELGRLAFGEDEESRYAVLPGLEVLTVDPSSYGVRFGEVSAIARHKAKEIVKIEYEGGEVRVTPDHSIMVVNERGELVSKKGSEIEKGDLLVSFKSGIEFVTRGVVRVDSPANYSNPGIKKLFGDLQVTSDTAWLFGLYLAEGAVGFGNGTSGQLIFTLGYPHELEAAKRVEEIAKMLEISTYVNLASSGFDRSRYSAIQVRLLNTQLARFVASKFHEGERRIARNKRIPEFVFNLPLELRREFLRGYMGEASGEWGSVVRYSSISQELLVDAAWLARITGIESSVFKGETRLIWRGGVKWCKSDLLPAKPFLDFLEEASASVRINWRYLLRHQLYEGKERAPKRVLRAILSRTAVEELDEELCDRYFKLRRLAYSDLYVVKVTSVEKERYDGWVYDVGVPGAEAFWGGTTPILLHNSDERGINVIRQRIKDYARTMPIGEVPFKLIILDEADNMTGDAQQALRRTMELYSRTARFCLIANYLSKIIEPIQSRCAIFRFQPIPKDALVERLRYIAECEGVKVTEDGYEAIWEECQGDLRKAINVLQAASALDEVVTEDVVYKVLGKVTPSEVREMLKLALDGDFLKAREKLRSLMLYYGLSGVDVLKLMYREVLSPRAGLDIPDRVRVELIELMGEVNYRMVEGADDEIQLSALLAKMALIGARAKSQ